MPKADVGPNVKLFGQDTGQYCGEATGQMTRNGYPKPGDRVFYLQSTLSNIIEAHKSNPDRPNWATDPQGLRLCLQLLSNAPVNWVERASTDRRETQLFIQQCIDQEKFPTAVLVNKGRHWVLVVGWETAAAGGGLKYVHYYDPQPVHRGADITVTAKTWNGAKRFSKVTIKGTWMNKFVAIGQRS